MRAKKKQFGIVAGGSKLDLQDRLLVRQAGSDARAATWQIEFLALCIRDIKAAPSMPLLIDLEKHASMLALSARALIKAGTAVAESPSSKTSPALIDRIRKELRLCDPGSPPESGMDLQEKLRLILNSGDEPVIKAAARNIEGLFDILLEALQDRRHHKQTRPPDQPAPV